MNKNWFKNLFGNFNNSPTIYPHDIQNIKKISLPKYADTVIVGGGLLGLSTALELSEAGQNVCVIEAGHINDMIPSGRSGGQFWPGYEQTLGEMIEYFGETIALAAWNLVHDAVIKIQYRIEDKCDFKPGVLLTSKTKSQEKWIESESKIYKKVSYDFAEYVDSVVIKNYVNTDLYRNGIIYKYPYGHVNPTKYIQRMANLVIKNDGKIFEDTAANEVRTENGKYVISTKNGEIVAENLVLATGVNFKRPDRITFDILPRIFIPVQTVILTTEKLSLDMAKEIVPGDACFCDASATAMNYGRLVLDQDGDYRLTFGGADALAQIQISLEIRKIEKEMKTMFPQLSKVRIEKIWTGSCDLSRNTLPIIINPIKGLYHASGFSGQGMVNTALYGSAIADKILNKDTGKFELLEKLNPEYFSKHYLIAWLQATFAMLLDSV